MASMILPYATEHYNSLPGIMESELRFKECRTIDAFGLIGEIFLKYRVQQKLGLALLHQHFALAADEKLVKFGNVAVPWKTAEQGDEPRNVSPTSWRFIKDGVIPYEFGWGSESKVSLDDYTDFLAHFSSALQEHGLSEILGLCTLDAFETGGEPSMEFTSGRANIMLPFDVSPNEGGAVDAAWQIERGKI